MPCGSISAGRRGFELLGVAVPRADREAAVVNLLRLHEARAAIVFCARRELAGALAGRLAARGFAVATLSGAMSQAGRNAALAALREGRARVCVATDLAARGFDLPGLDLVLHAELPGSAETLLHRSGRTGRAGRPGLAVLVATHGERRRAQALAARAGLGIDWVPAPDPGAVADRDFERMLADAGADPAPGEAAAAARLLALLAPERIAAAYQRLVGVDAAGIRGAGREAIARRPTVKPRLKSGKPLSSHFPATKNPGKPLK